MNSFIQALDRAGDGAIVTDRAQRILYWNSSATQLLGYACNDVLGRACYEILMGRDDHNRLVCRQHCLLTSTALAGRAVSDCDLCVRAQSGSGRWINLSTLAVPANGRESGLLLVHLFRDSTDKIQNRRFIGRVLDAARQLQGKEPGRAISLPSSPRPLTDLTRRENQVLSFLAQGVCANDMADALSISPSTVRNHVRNILSKLQVHSQLEAVVYAFEHGLMIRTE